MLRSNNAVFLKDDKEKSSKTSFCSSCEEKYGRIVKLVPRLLDDGLPDDKFLLCPNCTEIIPIYHAMLDSLWEPRAPSLPSNPFDSGVRVSVKSNKRITKANKVEGIEDPTEEIPLLGGMEDKWLIDTLKGKDRPAILNQLHDTIVEDDTSY